MKTRAGFVSNSSSSSFVCDVCGEIESGWDLCLVDAGMCECKNGHCFHDDCSDNGLSDYLEKCYEEEIEDPNNKGEYIENSDFDEDARYHVPERFCPICNFKIIEQNSLYRYALLKIGLTGDELKAEIKGKFKGGYDEFMKFLND